jgi:hypothetical protein
MKLIMQCLMLLICSTSFGQSNLPIYKNVKFVKDVELSLNENKIYVSSPFAKANLNFPKRAEFKNKKIKKITYLFSYNNENPEFAQSDLSNKRYKNLLVKLEGADLSKTVWETKAQAGCGLRPCSKELVHGFVIEFVENSFLGLDNLDHQLFKIENSVNQGIIGSSGTKIEIPADAFVDALGNEISGEINITLREAVEIEQIVLGGLYTTTDEGEILQSKGMIEVDAVQGDIQLYLKPDKSLIVEVPTDFEEGFSYYQSTEKEGRLVWENPVAIEGFLENEIIEESVIEDTEGDNNSDNVNAEFKIVNARDMMGFFPLKANYTQDGLMDMLIYKEGNRVKVTRKNLTNKFFEMNGFNFEEIKKIIGWFDADTVDLNDVVWVVQKQDNQLVINNNSINPGQNKNIFATNKLTNIFKMTKLGVANIDCLSRMKNSEMISLNIILDKETEMDEFNISLVVPSKKIFIQGYKKENGSYSFTHGDYEKAVSMPVGKTAYVVALGKSGTQAFLDIKEIKLGDFPIEHIVLEKIGKNEATNIIKSTF